MLRNNDQSLARKDLGKTEWETIAVKEIPTIDDLRCASRHSTKHLTTYDSVPPGKELRVIAGLFWV